MKCFINKVENWDDLIDRASFSHNTSVHEGTGYTPHVLIYGTPARIPSSFSNESDPKIYHSYLTDLFIDIHEIARANLIKAKLRSKEYYDKRIYPETFHAGERVFLVNDRKFNKFSNEYSGPYQIVECLDHENVQIKIRNTTQIVHTNKLKKCAYDEPG